MGYPHRTDKIVTYEDWTSWTERGFGYRAFLRRWWGRPLPDDSEIEVAQAIAYINEGRWVADCPDRCGNALMVTPNDPMFFCTECGQGWFKVQFPSKMERKGLEDELMKRGLVGGVPKHRNWNVGETLAELEDQTRRGAD